MAIFTPTDPEDGKPKDPVVQTIPDTEAQAEQPTAPDQFDEKYRTTRSEIWAYYSCVIFNFQRSPC
jgi:hypothetical protein